MISSSGQVCPNSLELSRNLKSWKSKPAAKKKDAYHETTLEDLNSTQMPLAQKIVIAAAIVCIIGAVIYYFAFLR